MRHSLRVASALAGVTLAAPIAVGAQHLTTVLPRMMVAPPHRNPPANNPARCPRVKPAYGSVCTPALRNTQCAYDMPGGTRVAYTCRSSQPDRPPFWATGTVRSAEPEVMEGPLPPPELPA